MAGGAMGSSGGGGTAQDLSQLSSILQRFGGGAGASSGMSGGNPLTNVGMQMMMRPQASAPMPMQSMPHQMMPASPMQGAMPPQMMGAGQGMSQTQGLLPWQAMMR